MHAGALLRDGADAHPERVLLRPEKGRVLSYGELHARAVRIASWLQTRLPPGSALGLLLHGNVDFTVACFGALYAGMRVLPLPRGESAARVKAKMAAARTSFLLGEGDGASLPWRECCDHGQSVDGLTLSPDGIALLLPTSGTSGTSKIACISHGSLAGHSRAVAQRLGLTERSVVLAGLPLCHSFGLRTTLMATLAARGQIVLLQRFEAAASLHRAAAEGVSFIAGVPTMFAAWAEVRRAPELSELRWCLSAGAPLSNSVRTRAEAVLGVEIRQGYGLTEASFSAIDAPPTPAAPETCGPPCPGVQVRIKDWEIQVRGANLFDGYLEDRRASEDAFDEGWLRTGDLGELDDAGRVVVRDRLKDLILRGGHNVVPAEVEAVLRSVAGVREAAVVGIEDARMGQEIVAVLAAEPSAVLCAEILARCNEALPGSHRPRRVAFLKDLPLGPSRKVLRRVLRAQLADGSLLSEPLPS